MCPCSPRTTLVRILLHSPRTARAFLTALIVLIPVVGVAQISEEEFAWTNTMAGVTATWDGTRTTLRPAADSECATMDGPWTLTLELDSIGRPGSMVPGGSGSATRDGDRITIERPWGDEWFINDDRGMEHGFTLTTRPAGASTRPVHLSIHATGDMTPVVDGPRQVRFIRVGYRSIVDYSGLRVWDTQGRDLPAHFEKTDTGILVVLDDADAEYPLVVDPLITSEIQEIVSPNPKANARFGAQVAEHLSTLVVSEVFGNFAGAQPETGATYVYAKDGSGNWGNRVALNPGGLAVKSGFGASLSCRGNWVAIGSPGDGLAGQYSGAVYVFRRSGQAWFHDATIRSTDGSASAGDLFGWSVSIWNGSPSYIFPGGPVLAVGAIGEKNGTQSGAAYVFRRNTSGVWQQEARTTSISFESSDFGSSVAISADHLFVGAPSDRISDQTTNKSGAVFAFHFNPTAVADPKWQLLLDHNPAAAWSSVLVSFPLQDGARFGQSLAFAKSSLVVGAPGAFVPETSPVVGLASFFKLSVADYSIAEKVEARSYGVEANGGFGSSVALGESGLGLVAAVGEPEPAGSMSPGRVHLFRQVVATNDWVKDTSISGSVAGGRFGSAVAISDQTMITGAADESVVNLVPVPNEFKKAGRVYVHELKADPPNTFQVGGKLEGEILLPGEVDRWVFDALKTTVVTFQVNGLDTMKPDIHLYNADTGALVPIETSGAGTAAVQVTETTLELSGRYRLEIGSKPSGAVAGTGRYSASSTRAFKDAKQYFGGDLDLQNTQPNDEFVVSFPAQPGSTLTLSTQKEGGTLIKPVVTAMTDPDGKLVDVHSYVKKPTPGNTKKFRVIKDMPLDQSGNYVVFMKNVFGSGDAKVVWKVTPPAITKGVWEEGRDRQIELLAAKVMKSGKKNERTIGDLLRAARHTYDLLDDPSNAQSVVERSLSAFLKPYAKKKGSELDLMWKGTESAGEFHSLLSLAGTGRSDLSPVSEAEAQKTFLAPDAKGTVVYMVGTDRRPIANRMNTLLHVNDLVQHHDASAGCESLDPATCPILGSEFRSFHVTTDTATNKKARIEAAALGLLQSFGPYSALQSLGGGQGWSSLAEPYANSWLRVAEAWKKPSGEISELLNQSLTKLYQEPTGTNKTQDATTLRHLIKMDLACGLRVVLVAYSQGNWYARQATSFLSATELQRVAIVAVASPFTYQNAASFGEYAEVSLLHDPGLTEAISPNVTNHISDLCEETCANATLCATLEQPLERHAVHLFDASYMGFSTSATAISQRILDAWATLPPPVGHLRQGVVQVVAAWSQIDKIAHVVVTEPGGAEISFQNKTGASSPDPSKVSGFMEAYVSDQLKGTRESYVIGLESRVQVGTYKVRVDVTEESGPYPLDVYVRAGSRFYHGVIQEPVPGKSSFTVATIKCSANGEFKIKGKLN